MTWKSRGLRGSELESRINFTIDILRKEQIALIQKIPTPITPVRLDGHGHITLAYFDQKSTVDYIGAVQGIPVCFDAKECKVDTFPLSNIHEHQMEFMKDFEKQDGIAFFILYFTHRDEYVFLPYEQAEVFWQRMEDGGRKSFRYDELDRKWFIKEKAGQIEFLNGVNLYLSWKDSAKDGTFWEASGTPAGKIAEPFAEELTS